MKKTVTKPEARPLLHRLALTFCAASAVRLPNCCPRAFAAQGHASDYLPEVRSWNGAGGTMASSRRASQAHQKGERQESGNERFTHW